MLIKTINIHSLSTKILDQSTVWPKSWIAKSNAVCSAGSLQLPKSNRTKFGFHLSLSASVLDVNLVIWLALHVCIKHRECWFTHPLNVPYANRPASGTHQCVVFLCLHVCLPLLECKLQGGTRSPLPLQSQESHAFFTLTWVYWCFSFARAQKTTTCPTRIPQHEGARGSILPATGLLLRQPHSGWTFMGSCENLREEAPPPLSLEPG